MKHAATHPTRSIGFLSRLHDGELSEPERREFEEHSSECAECAAAAREFEEILALYRQAREEPSDPDLASRITRRLDARLRWRPPVRYVRLEIDLLWASVVATCLIAVLALYNFRPARRRAPASVVAESGIRGPAAESPATAPSESNESKPSRKTGARRPTIPPPETSTRADFAPERPAQPSPAPSEPASRAEGSPERRTAPAESASTTASESAAVSGDAASRDDLPASIPTRPTLIHRVEPIIPEALRQGILPRGPITAEAVITESGDVTSVRVLQPVPAGLERSIQDALRKWKYKPALLAGRPVRAYLDVVIYVNP